MFYDDVDDDDADDDDEAKDITISLFSSTNRLVKHFSSGCPPWCETLFEETTIIYYFLKKT